MIIIIIICCFGGGLYLVEKIYNTAYKLNAIRKKKTRAKSKKEIAEYEKRND